jgi:malonyl-CoA/methylmalonyl-CoA synthetase
MNHLYDLIRARMPGADRPFAHLTDGRHYTYGDVQDVSARFATVLAGLGVEPGDRVAVQVEKSVEALMLYLACLRAGAAFLPLNTAYTPAEVAYFLGDAEPRLFVCDPARKDVLAPAAASAGARLETLGVGRLRTVRRGRSPTRASPRPPSSRTSPAAPTTSRRSFTHPAPPADPRGRCSPTTTSPPTP